MKIYVVEAVFDDTIQLGFSTSKKIAEQKAKEWTEGFEKYHGYKKSAWVTEYKESKNLYCEFN